MWGGFPYRCVHTRSRPDRPGAGISTSLAAEAAAPSRRGPGDVSRQPAAHRRRFWARIRRTRMSARRRVVVCVSGRAAASDRSLIVVTCYRETGITIKSGLAPYPPFCSPPKKRSRRERTPAYQRERDGRGRLSSPFFSPKWCTCNHRHAAVWQWPIVKLPACLLYLPFMEFASRGDGGRLAFRARDVLWR